MYGTPESLVCPVCRAALRRDGSSLVCGGARRHCYDIAASGYVNLLPPGKASNAKTGDDRRMLSSRSAFLSTGVYDEFSREIARLADKNLSVGDGRVMLADAGCGEGYHTLNIARCLDGAGRSVCFAGFDASKYGADRASKRLKSERGLFPDSVFAAANIFDMPLRGGCADVVISMFAPVPWEEALRILKPGGLLIICSSGKRHLWEMRCVLYGEPRVSEPHISAPEGFALLDTSTVSYTAQLCGGDMIAALFEMTPFFFRCPKEGREKLLSLESLGITCEAEYKVYKKAYN